MNGFLMCKFFSRQVKKNPANQIFLDQLTKFSERNKQLKEIKEPIEEQIYDIKVEKAEIEQSVDNMFNINTLVLRPSKSHKWSEENNYSSKIHFDQYLSIDKFDNAENVAELLKEFRFHDIKIMPTMKLGLNHLKENTILCTGYNNKHIYKFGREFVKKLKDGNFAFKRDILKDFTLNGRKHDELMRIEIGEIEIFFMTEGRREELDLENVWTKKTTQLKELLGNELLKEQGKKRKYKL